MKTQRIVVVTVLCLFAGVFVFSEINNYINSRCAASFGLEFNKKRKELHVPIIPSDWKIYNRDATATLWEVPKVKRGHGFKVVVYDGCELDGEEDHYYFSSKKIQDTVLRVNHLFANKSRSKDSTIFTFQVGHDEDTISSRRADSILMANKISWDL